MAKKKKKLKKLKPKGLKPKRPLGISPLTAITAPKKYGKTKKVGNFRITRVKKKKK